MIIWVRFYITRDSSITTKTKNYRLRQGLSTNNESVTKGT